MSNELVSSRLVWTRAETIPSWVLPSPSVLVQSQHAMLRLCHHASALPARYRFTAFKRAGGTVHAPHLPTAGPGLPAGLPSCVTHGPGLRECPNKQKRMNCGIAFFPA